MYHYYLCAADVQSTPMAEPYSHMAQKVHFFENKHTVTTNYLIHYHIMKATVMLENRSVTQSLLPYLYFFFKSIQVP